MTNYYKLTTLRFQLGGIQRRERAIPCFHLNDNNNNKTARLRGETTAQFLTGQTAFISIEMVTITQKYCLEAFIRMVTVYQIGFYQTAIKMSSSCTGLCVSCIFLLTYFYIRTFPVFAGRPYNYIPRAHGMYSVHF